MCEVTNLSTNGNLEEFEATFEDCNNNPASLTFSLVGQNGGLNTYSVTGTNTNNGQVDEQAEVDAVANIDPQEVFWAVYKILKDKLCPTCS